MDLAAAIKRQETHEEADALCYFYMTHYPQWGQCDGCKRVDTLLDRWELCPECNDEAPWDETDEEWNMGLLQPVPKDRQRML